MSGIDSINLIRFSALVAPYSDRLTPATKAKLIALGVDVSNIRTETKGQEKLREALADRMTYEKKPELKLKQKIENPALEEARSLAEDLNISVGDNDSVEDIINLIKVKVNELFSDAGEDFDKRANASYYDKQLSLLEKSQNSVVDLSSSMDFTANMNIAFHGLY